MPDDVEAGVSNTNGPVDGEQGGARRKRTQRPFPAASFKEAAELAEAMVEIAGGSREVRRITLFDHGPRRAATAAKPSSTRAGTDSRRAATRRRH